jgi:hypothetical protein
VLTSTGQSLKCAVSGAGIAQLVEHDLAKVGVASSSLVSRSMISSKPRPTEVLFFSERRSFAPLRQHKMAWWQSGHAAACKAVYAGSIPTQASILTTIEMRE